MNRLQRRTTWRKTPFGRVLRQFKSWDDYYRHLRRRAKRGR